MKKRISVKTIAIILVILMALAAICIFGYIVYKNIFAGVKSKRLDGVKEHPVTQEEISAVTDVYKELEQLDKVEIDTEKNSKIITIHVTLKEDVDFNRMKEVCNNSITKFSEKNLGFYDLEVFVSSNNKESEVYPQIGYKHRAKTEFSW